ncbi:MAG: methylglyoxal synthase [Bacteroidales bacterium]|nr:methylglyoxal synthase [Bacteroidales bacterium]MBN2697582.1 methylglyoxal synthase [Bacteroidales bacterium]
MDRIKNIALVAHDNRKQDLTEWVEYNADKLSNHHLICTGTTGRMVEETLDRCDRKPLSMRKLKSGPLGGDQQLGALTSEGEIDILIFFWDPMQPQPHDVDVKALLRITVLYNVPTACNRSTADFLIDSPHFSQSYNKSFKDYSYYINRSLD